MASVPVFLFLRDKRDILCAKPGYEALTTACEVTGVTYGEWLRREDLKRAVLELAELSEDTCRALVAFINIAARRRTCCAFLSRGCLGC
jgi:hypothetical protein